MKSLAGALAFLLAAVPGTGHGACTQSAMPDGRPRFVIQGGEVRDQKTGLIWQRCSVGLTWSAKAGCAGERAEVTFEAAQQAATQAGGAWRLPTLQELGSLVDSSCGRPAIDKRFFPDVTASTDEGAEEYWTSTPGGLDEMMYFVEFADGYSDIRSPGFSRNARLVRPAK